MIVLPTMGRPASLTRFVEAYKRTSATLPIHVVMDAADAWRYNDVVTPDHWKRCSVPTGMRLGDIFNTVYRTFPDEFYYGMVADDVVPETPGWDVTLANACQPDKISWGCDGIQNEHLPVHPFIGGNLVRALGWWATPGIKHWFVDNVWKHLAVSLDCAAYLPNVIMRHLHPAAGTARSDRTYENQPSHGADQATYLAFMQNQFPSIVEKIKSNANTVSTRCVSSA